jgi:hypothetical protein
MGDRERTIEGESGDERGEREREREREREMVNNSRSELDMEDHGI